MNERFFLLAPEKRSRIINAGIEVFAQNSYRGASTDEIAAKAQISKGLLFYYFNNKKELYMFLYNYSEKLMEEYLSKSSLNEYRDFFEMMEYATVEKLKFIEKNPYITEFIIKAYTSKNEVISFNINSAIQQSMDSAMSTYFQNIDITKFKPEIKPERILKMLAWMADGYLHEQERAGKDFNIDELILEFRVWSNILRKVSYKEEYLSGNN